VDATLLSASSVELQKKLSTVLPTTRFGVEPPAAGSLVITGCLTRIDAGNGAKRTVGMNFGASHLEAHVRVLSVTDAGPNPFDEFDLKVKGGSLLPPLGPVGVADHAVAESRD
jgi:hypothetical protein